MLSSQPASSDLSGREQRPQPPVPLVRRTLLLGRLIRPRERAQPVRGGRVQRGPGPLAARLRRVGPGRGQIQVWDGGQLRAPGGHLPET